MKVKIQLSLSRNEEVWGNGDTAPLIHNLGNVWWLIGQLQAPAVLPRYPLDRRFGGLQSRSGRSEEKNSQLLPGLEPPIIQPVAQRYTN
jgi:hypothetical protein